ARLPPVSSARAEVLRLVPALAVNDDGKFITWVCAPPSPLMVGNLPLIVVSDCSMRLIIPVSVLQAPSASAPSVVMPASAALIGSGWPEVTPWTETTPPAGVPATPAPTPICRPELSTASPTRLPAFRPPTRVALEGAAAPVVATLGFEAVIEPLIGSGLVALTG